MCCNSVIWLSEVCYNVSIVDSVVYNKFCILDMLLCLEMSIYCLYLAVTIKMVQCGRDNLH